ncbi:MAG: hypothetical protein MJZ29_02430 [Bacteroidaceae bacterium]|nr:hypothetical protein [Bacteroidaceae bacterium]
MEEKMTPETIWYLKEMVAKSDKEFAEGKFYTHEQVMEMLKARKNEDKVVTACV